MTEPKHTPGPWEVVRHNKNGEPDPTGESLWVYPVEGGGMGWVGDSYFGAHIPSENGGEANAKLVAAAPELLGLALSLQKWLMTDIEKSHIGADDMRVYHLDGAVLSNLLNEARDVIAKATA